MYVPLNDSGCVPEIMWSRNKLQDMTAKSFLANRHTMAGYNLFRCVAECFTVVQMTARGWPAPDVRSAKSNPRNIIAQGRRSSPIGSI